MRTIIQQVIPLRKGEKQPDMALLAAIHKAAFGQDLAWDDSVFRSLLSLPGYEAWVIFVQSYEQMSPGGLLVWRDCAPSLTPLEGEIITLAVDPAYQRRGLARALLEQLMESLSPQACLFLEVSVKNEAAQSLYSSMGFKYIGLRKNYYNDDSDAKIMKFSQDK